MRKVIYVFVFFISLFVFNNQFIQEKEIEETKMLNLVSLFSENEQKQIQLFDLKVPQNREQFYQELNDFVYSQNDTALIYTSEQDDDLVKHTTHYLYSTNTALTLKNLYLQEGKTIDFQKKSEHYYSSSFEDESSNHFDFLNRNMYKEYNGVYRIYPFSQIEKDSHNRYYLYFITDDPQAVIAEMQASPLGQYLSADWENTEYTPITAGEIDTSLSEKLLFVCEIAVALLLLCDVFHQRKEILVRKTFGMPTAYITFKLYFTFILKCIACYLIGLIISWLIFIKEIRESTYAFLTLQLQGFLRFFIYMAVIYVILHIFIYGVRKAEHLKKGNGLKNINYVNLGLKTIVLLMIFSPFVDFVSLGVSEVKNMYYLNTQSDELRNNVYIEGIEAGAEGEGISYAKEYFKEHGGVYQDFIINHQTDSDDIPVFEKPHIEVDYNYLSEYELKDEEGKKLTIDEDMGEVLLVPKKYKGEVMDLYEYGSGEIIYIENGMQFYNMEPSTATDYGWVVKDPIVSVVDLVDSGTNWNLPFMLLPYDDEKELKKIINDFKQKGVSVELSTTARRYDNVYEMVKDNFLECIYLLIMYSIVILAFLYQNIYMYFIETKEAFALRYLHGYSFIERHGELIVKNTMIYIFPLFYGYFYLHLPLVQILAFIIFAILFELIAIYLLTRKLEKNQIIEVLKGE